MTTTLTASAPQLPPLEWELRTLPSVPDETSLALAQRELFVYWSCARSRPLPLSLTGFVQKRALRALNEQLITPDPLLGQAAQQHETPRLRFLRLMLQGLGLCVRSNHHLRASGSPLETPAFWSLTLRERTRSCLQVWQRLAEWSELNTLGMSTFDLDLARARQSLLLQLADLEPGVWLSAERFLERLSLVAPRLVFQTQDNYPGHTYYNDAKHVTQQTRWVAEVEAAFVGGAISGPLHWLGLIDISEDAGRLLAFRLSEEGSSVLRPDAASAVESSEPEGRLVVQPSFQLLALGDVPESTLARLELFAERVKADRGAFEYRLSRQTFYAAQRQGLSANVIVDFLQQAAGTPLPQNVLRSLREWGEQLERIIIRRSVSLCEATSADSADSLWDDPTIRAHIDRRLTPQVLLLKRGNASALREALFLRGFLPASTRRGDSATGRAVTTSEGEIRPFHPGPDLVLSSRIADLAEAVDGRFAITRESLARGSHGDSTVSGFLDRLSSIHRGPIPRSLVTRIKAWGRYYGGATLRRPLLLEVKDSTTAQELLADPELKGLLASFDPDSTGRLLMVQAAVDLKALQLLLLERGIEVDQPNAPSEDPGPEHSERHERSSRR